jgi:hypothetical protein
MPETFRPFYCGTQSLDWKTWNCDNCQKGYDCTTKTWRCDLEEKIDLAYFGDGSVTEDIARRMGCLGNEGKHNWRCGELVEIMPTEEYYECFLKPPVTCLAPLWLRVWRSLRFAFNLWIPLWRPKEDIWGVLGRISLWTAWDVAWGIHHDDRVRCLLGIPQ